MCVPLFGLAAAASFACSSSSDCKEGEATCSADGLELEVCRDGEREVVQCMRQNGQLCEAGACVDPWRYGSPVFGTCPNDPLARPERLADKAAAYDDIAVRLHIHPGLKWISNVTLPPGVPESAATWMDVVSWRSGENDGLWSALYLTSQAFRYAVTRSPEALATIRLLLDGEATRVAITGVKGLFTRQYVPPGIRYLSCPTEDSAYTTDAEKDDNKWVQIRNDGCAWVVDRATNQWTKSSHCGLDAFHGWCFKDNVSKDEYSGHMLALGAIVKLVDDPEVKAKATDLLRQVGEALVEQKLELKDWDGRIPEHGKFSPYKFDDFPGFNAAMAMDFVLMAAEATGRADIRAYYDDCMLQKGGKAKVAGCFDTALEEPESFPEFLKSAGMYVGPEGCASNYNNISMHMLSLHNLIWFEKDPSTRELFQRSLDVDVMRAEQPRRILDQNNALFDFIWAAHKKLGPGSDGPALAAVEDGICQLKQFRPSQAEVDITLPPKYQPYCKSRNGSDVSQYPRETAERCAATFVWWGDPYSLRTCTQNDRDISQPAGYLLPYWMGRYYGFIPADL